MTMNAARLRTAMVDGIKLVVTTTTAQDTGMSTSLLPVSQAIIDEIEDYYGGGATPSHATLSAASLVWTASGHTGTGSTIAAFDGGGVAAALTIGTTLTDGGSVLDIVDNVVLPGVERMRFPGGTTAQRPGTPADGDVRWNSTTTTFEYWWVSKWTAIIDYDQLINYAGSSALITVGTVTVGTWHGSTIGPTYGGTGLTTYTLGDMLYASAANTLNKLAGNTSATRKFLRQTGTGAVSAAPAWDTVVVSDIDAGLASLASADNTASQRLLYTTTTDTWTSQALTAAGLALLDDADASAQRATLGLTIGTNVQAWDADLDAIAALGSTGYAVRTAANTWAQRTLTGTANQVSVTNGDGTTGNPVFSTPQDLDTAATFRVGKLGVGVAAGAAAGNIRTTGPINVAGSTDLTWSASQGAVYGTSGALWFAPVEVYGPMVNGYYNGGFIRQNAGYCAGVYQSLGDGSTWIIQAGYDAGGTSFTWTQRWGWDNTGVYKPYVDNTYDIGTSLLRARDLYVARNTATGNVNLGGSTAHAWTATLYAVSAASGAMIFAPTEVYGPACNAYHDAGWKRKQAGMASAIYQSIGSGEIWMLVAPAGGGVGSALTFTQTWGWGQSGEMKPFSDNTKDIGTTTLGIRDIYIAGAIKRGAGITYTLPAVSGTFATLAGVEALTNKTVTFAAGSASASSKSKLTSGTVLTAPEAGALEYDGAAFYLTTETTSGREQNVTEHVWRLTAAGPPIGPAIADFFGANSSISLPASGMYELEAELYFRKTTAGTVVVTVTTSAANYTSFSGSLEIDAVTGGTVFQTITRANIHAGTVAAQAFPATGVVSDATNHKYTLKVVFQNNGAGNIRIRFTSSAGTVTPGANSFYKIRRIPGNIGTFVA